MTGLPVRVYIDKNEGLFHWYWLLEASRHQRQTLAMLSRAHARTGNPSRPCHRRDREPLFLSAMLLAICPVDGSALPRQGKGKLLADWPDFSGEQ